MAQTPPSSPPRTDNSIIKWALLYLLIVCSFVIAAELVTEGDSSSLVSQMLNIATPIGAVLIIAIKGGEVVQQNLNQNTRIEAKTDVQTQKIEKIEHAVNGKLDARFDTVTQETAALKSEISSVKADVLEIRDMLRRALEE